MKNRTVRNLIGGLGFAVVMIAVLVVVLFHFMSGNHLISVDLMKYVDVKEETDGSFTVSLDTDRMLFESHLPNPTKAAQGDYPDVAVLRALVVEVPSIDESYKTRDDANQSTNVRLPSPVDAYTFEICSTYTAGDPSKALKDNGVRILNTTWSWTETDLRNWITKQTTDTNPDGSLTLKFSDYVRVSKNDDGSYALTLDKGALLTACRFTLPADPTTHTGYQAVMSLGVSTSVADGVYTMQATSTEPNIMSMLAQNGITLSSIEWSWTTRELDTLISSQPQETQTPVAAPSDSTSPDVSQSPDASATVTATPTATSTASATATPTTAPSKDGCITTLYQYDQTELRKIIRAAKESHYGSKFESGEIKYNYFAVGKTGADHANCFRVVYLITTTSGSEYLIADVYDVASESGFKTADVVLKTVSKSSDAKSTADLADYTVYTLTGGSMVFTENNGASPFDSDGLVEAESISRQLSYSELWDIPATKDYTLLQLLGYARNEMFARAGHKFNESGSYYKHFSQYSWYKPTGSITTDALVAKWSSTKGNITTIKFLEKLIKEG